MIRLNQAIVVEGKYDKIKLSNFIDATIIATDGFSIFNDIDKRNFIKLLAKSKGIIVLTDSDSAGNIIRSHLKQICPEGSIVNAYVPQLVGKEKRKHRASKEGYLGVEGLTEQTILDALKRSGIFCEDAAKTKKITKTDAFSLGLSGRENSAAMRKSLARYLKLPENLSSNSFLDCINAVYKYEDFVKAVHKWRQEADKK